jgi:hemoglobin
MTTADPRQDIDHRAAVAPLVDSFYDRVLSDPMLAPIFTDIAAIELDQHLLRIKAFWGRMLLHEPGYDRNMVAHHARIHARFSLQRYHYDHWLTLFHETVDAGFPGPRSEYARSLATTIARNLERHLNQYGRRTEMDAATDSGNLQRGYHTRSIKTCD